jgi:hypothetical protein
MPFFGAIWRAAIAGTILASIGVCQPMGDHSSIYSDIWNDSTYMYGSGATQGQIAVHMYSVDVKLTSPSGRVAQSSPEWYSDYAYNEVYLLIDYTENGDWVVTTKHNAYCTVAAVYFLLGQLSETRKTPTQYCKDGTTVSYCADGNKLAPIGRMTSHTCAYYDKYCKAGGDAAPGYCRRETCAKCTGQKMDAKPSQCTNRDVCNSSIATMCMGACQ